MFGFHDSSQAFAPAVKTCLELTRTFHTFVTFAPIFRACEQPANKSSRIGNWTETQRLHFAARKFNAKETPPSLF
jgi:hypothetical protein